MDSLSLHWCLRKSRWRPLQHSLPPGTSRECYFSSLFSLFCANWAPDSHLPKSKRNISTLLQKSVSDSRMMAPTPSSSWVWHVWISLLPSPLAPGKSSLLHKQLFAKKCWLWSSSFVLLQISPLQRPKGRHGLGSPKGIVGHFLESPVRMCPASLSNVWVLNTHYHQQEGIS